MTQNSTEASRINAITSQIIGAAISVHDELGPGMLESAYEACMVHELMQRGLRVERQKPLPLVYKGMTIECGYRLDLLVEESVIVELKSVDRIESVHSKQVLTYLKLSGIKVGLLINFNVEYLRMGLTRLVNGLEE
jgi:GxxExxY protein